jgi:hypothetical protein
MADDRITLGDLREHPWLWGDVPAATRASIARLCQMFARAADGPLSRFLRETERRAGIQRRAYVAFLERAYVKTENPLFALRACQESHSASEAPPPRSAAYLDESIRRLLESADRPLEGPGANVVAEALRLRVTTGKNSPLSEYRNRWPRIERAERVQAEIESGLDPEVAAQEVADALGLRDSRPVLACWRRYRALLTR